MPIGKIRRWIFLAAFCAIAVPGFADDRPPVTPDDLKMTEEPLAPGAAAIILYRQVDRNDDSEYAYENHFIRLKILKEEGRRYANIEIPYEKTRGSHIARVSARTIKPDGSVVELTDKPFDKTLLRSKGVKYMAKTFTLPDVQVGSVIEYSYLRELPGNFYDSHWILSDDLFTKYAKFSLKPGYGPFGLLRLHWASYLLPAGCPPPQQGSDHTVRMEAHNIPAFQTEDYMPPEDELKSRVEFRYGPGADPATFWKAFGVEVNQEIEDFLRKPKAMEETVARLVSSSDPAELKLQKIYDWVQRLRNISYELAEAEPKQKKEKNKLNAEDVLKRGFGTDLQLNLLFLGLARAAGLNASAVYTSDRRRYLFSPASMNAEKLDYVVVIVRINDDDIYCDPGTPFAPMRLLRWPETGVQGLLINQYGGRWITTVVPKSGDSRTHRQAVLSLSEVGDLEGTVSFTFTGLEAIRLRSEEWGDDNSDKRKILEQLAKGVIPGISEVELSNTPDWKTSNAPLVAEFKIRVHGWATAAGKKFTLPVGLFSAGEKHIFEHVERVHPIYFAYPNEQDDDITITLPSSWKVLSVPSASALEEHDFGYTLVAENRQSSVHLSRKLSTNALILKRERYASLREFFQKVRTTDEEQILLQPANAAASN